MDRVSLKSECSPVPLSQFFHPVSRCSGHHKPEVTHVNAPGRPEWIFVATVVLACFVTSGRLSAQKDQEARSSIVGEWTLDKKLSDVAEDRPHEGAGQHSRGGGGFPGGGGHGHGGFHGGGGGYSGGHAADPDETARRQEAWRDLVTAPDHMTIVQTESMIVITSRDGRTTRLSPDGKKIKDESTNIERKTRWEEGKLVTEISGTSGHATETYLVNPTQHELLVVVRLESSDAMKPSACSIASTRSTHADDLFTSSPLFERGRLVDDSRDGNRCGSRLTCRRRVSSVEEKPLSIGCAVEPRLSLSKWGGRSIEQRSRRFRFYAATERSGPFSVLSP